MSVLVLLLAQYDFIAILILQPDLHLLVLDEHGLLQVGALTATLL